LADIALELNRVYKQFRKGEKFDSLRDFVPSLALSLFGMKKKNPMKKQEFWALNDVSFQIKKGEALGIIGSNGAGKSTILKLLTRIMNPTKGSIFTNGRLSALIEVGAGFHPDLTGRENVFLNGIILGMKKKEIKARFDAIVEFSGLEEFIDTPVKRYSSGMYARLGFSVAAHLEPDILIVDEVLSVGDYAFQNKCAKKMKSSIKEGVTVIFVSHNLQAISEVCQQCILLEKGRNILEGPTNEVIRHYLNSLSNGNEEKKDTDAIISAVTIHSQNGNGPQFNAGEKIQVDIEVAARVYCEKLSVNIVIMDDQQYNIFNTSTERLTQTTFSLLPGEKKKISFELMLHLAPGTYHLGTYIYRYDIEKTYDLCFPAAKIYVRSDVDVKGVVHMYPKLNIE
jgi:lipopolysaccharide transport system ATP-binding protein